MATRTFPEFLKWCRAYLRQRWTSRENLRELYNDNRDGGAFTYCGGCRKAIVVKEGMSSDLYQACPHCDHCESCCSCVFCQNCDEECNERYCGDCERCVDCCECTHCSACSRTCTDDQCSTCDRCDQCCECVTCEHCDERVRPRNFCCDCNQCSGCCSCDRANIKFFTSPLRFHGSLRTERKVNPSARFVAAEIEISAVDRGDAVADTVRKWSGSIVEDGSLPDSGFEINTAPASGDRFVKQITEICTSLNAGGARVGTECGLHVHIDARDFDYLMIRRLVNLYAKIEPTLFNMVPPSRKNSNYCAPCGDRLRSSMKERGPYKFTKEAVINGIYPELRACEKGSNYGRYLRSLKDNKYYTGRYNALNIHSWFHRRTIECRMFNGTANADKIISWGMLWARILDYVARSSDKEVDALTGCSKEILEEVASLPRLVTFIRQRITTHGA